MKKLVLITGLVSLLSLSMAAVSYQFVDLKSLEKMNFHIDLGEEGENESEGEGEFNEADLVEFETEKVFSFSSTDQLKIRLLSGQVNIRPSQGDQIKVHIKGMIDQKYAGQVEGFILRKEDKVEIALGQRKQSFKGNWRNLFKKTSSNFPESAQVEIEVPVRFKKLDISGMSTDLNIVEISPEEVELRTVSGNISLESVLADEIEIKSVSGDATMNNSGADRISIKLVSGNVDFLPLLNEKYKIEFESLSGNMYGEEAITGGSTKKIKVKTISGDVNFNSKSSAATQ